MKKQTQTKPILPPSMAGKIALSEVEGPVMSLLALSRVEVSDPIKIKFDRFPQCTTILVSYNAGVLLYFFGGYEL
jgi:hypothetical protein